MWISLPGRPIEVLYAWVASNPNGSERIIGQTIKVDHQTVVAHLIAVDKAGIEALRPVAKMAAETTGLPVRLVAFTTRTMLEDAP